MKYLLYPDITEDYKEKVIACVLVNSLEDYTPIEKDRVKEELIKKNKGLSDKLTEVIFVTREGKVAGNFYYVNKKMDDIILKFTTDTEVKKKLAKDIEENGEVI